MAWYWWVLIVIAVLAVIGYVLNSRNNTTSSGL
jgi:hypothetical protein